MEERMRILLVNHRCIETIHQDPVTAEKSAANPEMAEKVRGCVGLARTRRNDLALFVAIDNGPTKYTQFPNSDFRDLPQGLGAAATLERTPD